MPLLIKDPGVLGQTCFAFVYTQAAPDKGLPVLPGMIVKKTSCYRRHFRRWISTVLFGTSCKYFVN